MTYILMNGSSGCLPDNVEEYDTKEDAIYGASDLFEDLPDNILSQMRRMLREDGIYYFDAEAQELGAGADYVEVTLATD
jgi:hypothetical protein